MSQSAQIEAIIILNNPRMPPDMRIRVFDTDFLVHSQILKLYSEFFATYLDSPDKTPAAAGAKYRYEWVTKVEKMGVDYAESLKHDYEADSSWCLVCTGDKAGDLNLDAFIGSKELETVSFKRLLKAVYNQPWSIDSEVEASGCKQFVTMTSLARYYRLLPVMSRSLYQVIHRDTFFDPTLPHKAAFYLGLAAELRDFDLFHDCLMYCIGPWPNPQYQQINDERLRKIAKNVRNELGTKILDSQDDMFRQFHYEDSYHDSHYMSRRSADALADGIRSNLSNIQLTTLPALYHKMAEDLQDQFVREKYTEALEEFLSPLMANKLRIKSLATTHNASNGYFLCADITHDDIPWDTTEIFW